MNKIIPFFELNGTRYEIKKTRWLVAELSKLSEASSLSDEDRLNTVKASNLIADAKKFTDKAKELWDKLCEEPTEENRATYFMFKKMSDDAVSEYNNFILTHDSIQNASKTNIDILEKIAIKGLAEQHFGMNMEEATKTWEAFVDSQESQNDVVEWLSAMSQCLFVEEEERDGNDFLSQMRMRKDGARKKK